MKKIKLFFAVAIVSTLIGVTSFAAVTTTPKGVQKLDSADIVDALNNNADVLDGHVDKIAGTDVFGHIKIGSGLQVSEDGVANVKIANDLQTDDAETALSASMGLKLNNNVNTLSSNIDTLSGDVNTLGSNMDTLSGDINTLSINMDTLSGDAVKVKSMEILTGDLTPGDQSVALSYPVGAKEILAVVVNGWQPATSWDTKIYVKGIAINTNTCIMYVEGSRTQSYALRYIVLYK